MAINRGLLLLIVNLQLALCSTIGEYIDIRMPTTYRWELSNKYALVTLDWKTGEFIDGQATSRDSSPECVLEQEVDCPPSRGKSIWHCYKCTAKKAVPAGHSCHFKFFRNLDLTDVTCKLIDHYTEGNSTLIDTGLYPRTFNMARRKCTTPAIYMTPMPPDKRTICAEKHRGRILSDSSSCTSDSCSSIMCGKSNMGGDCCSSAGCSGNGDGTCTCNSPPPSPPPPPPCTDTNCNGNDCTTNFPGFQKCCTNLSPCSCDNPLNQCNPCSNTCKLVAIGDCTGVRTDCSSCVLTTNGKTGGEEQDYCG